MEKNVFVIASGNNIPQQLLLKDSSVVIDNAENCLGDLIELKFDGSDDNVHILPNPTFDFGSDQDFTIECRVRTTTAADVAIVGNKDWNSGLNKGFVFSFKFPAGPEWKVNIGDGTNRADINTGGEIADNEWHTLSATFDRDDLLHDRLAGLGDDDVVIRVLLDHDLGLRRGQEQGRRCAQREGGLDVHECRLLDWVGAARAAAG